MHQAIHKPLPTIPSSDREGIRTDARSSGDDVHQEQLAAASREGTAAAAGHAFAAVAVHAPNRTGLPDDLKSGVERLAGMSLDDVRVHYNSAKPAQLDALAYTQGRDIHVAPGQEQHLPHEAWHVVQQAQGRVKPTVQMKHAVLNDDEGLEHEAEAKGATAAALSHVRVPSRVFQGRAEQTEAHPQQTPLRGTGERGLNRLVSPIQCKKVIRNGQIVDEPEPQQPPVDRRQFFPGEGHPLGDELGPMPPSPELPQQPPVDRRHLFPGEGQRLGSDAVTTPGRMMVSRAVASSIFRNHVSGLPPLRPDLGKVGGVTWTVTSETTPHTGIDQQQEGGERKDVPIGVNINVPRLREGGVSPNPRLDPVAAGNDPFTTVVSTADLERRSQDRRRFLTTDPAAREQARQLGVARKKAEIERRIRDQDFNDAEQTRLRNAQKGGLSREAAIARMKEQLTAEAERSMPASVNNPPPTRVEQAMWRQVGEDVRGSSSGLGRVELRDSRFSRSANGDFTLIGPQARQLVTLDQATALRAQQQAPLDRTEESERARRDQIDQAQQMRQSVYHNHAEIRKTLREAEMERRKRR